MNRNPNRTWRLLAVIFVIIGVLVSYRLSGRASYNTFKFLNIVGICSELLGLLVLSYILTAPGRVKSFFANWLTVCVGHSMLFVPVGMFVAASIFSFLRFPSAPKTARLAASLFAYGCVPVILLEDFALIPKWQSFASDDARLKFLGGVLIIGGMLVQLVAAFLDFNS
jgi:hypothetical protein